MDEAEEPETRFRGTNSHHRTVQMALGGAQETLATIDINTMSFFVFLIWQRHTDCVERTSHEEMQNYFGDSC
jgi:hypothetical protein